MCWLAGWLGEGEEELPLGLLIAWNITDIRIMGDIEIEQAQGNPMMVDAATFATSPVYPPGQSMFNGHHAIDQEEPIPGSKFSKRRRSSYSIQSLCQEPSIAPNDRVLPPLEVSNIHTASYDHHSYHHHPYQPHRNHHPMSADGSSYRDSPSTAGFKDPQSSTAFNTAPSSIAPSSPTLSIKSSATGVVSLEDPDVRLAAEALGDLATTQSPITSAATVNGMHDKQQQPPYFLDRMSTYPMVSSALRTYETTKSKSRLLNYGAGMMESVTRPLLEPLDGFACRQLDRLESYYPTTLSPPSIAHSEEAKFRWQNMLISTSGLATSISDESVRSLSYLLNMLRSASSQIQSAVSALLALVYEQQQTLTHYTVEELNARRLAFNQRLAEIKLDIVRTVQAVIGSMSKHAGSALPEPARDKVRQYLLGLPSRWQAAATRQTTGSDISSLPDEKQQQHLGNGNEHEGANRLLGLARETLDVLGSVGGIVNDTLRSADGWYVWGKRRFYENIILINGQVTYVRKKGTTSKREAAK